MRRAHVEDADALAAVHVSAWRAAYRGVMSDDFLAAMDVTRWAEGWRRRLDAPESGVVTLVGVPTGHTVTDQQGDTAIVELRYRPTAAVTSNIS